MKAYRYIITILFIAFAAVQYNDPDPWMWILLYVYFALLAFSIPIFPKMGWLHIASALSALMWMYFQWPEKWEGLGDTMNNENVERGRESLGLLICAISALGNYWFCSKAKPK